jgi:hypothetical protein
MLTTQAKQNYSIYIGDNIQLLAFDCWGDSPPIAKTGSFDLAPESVN